MVNEVTLDKLITAYEVDVRFPDVSGMEHLNMLLVRSEIAQAEGDDLLSAEQRARLVEADRILFEQSDRFFRAIRSIADIQTWREHEGASPEHWWWYLDVLAQTPRLTQVEPMAVPA